MCLFPFFSFRKAGNVIYNDDLPAYRPIDKEPTQPIFRTYKYTLDISSPGTMTINARNDGTLIFHLVPTTTNGVSHGVSHGGIVEGVNDTNVGLSAEARQEKLDQTKLRLQEARARFQESMDRLNQELTIVKDYDSVTLLEDEEEGGLTGDRLFYEDNCKDLVKI
ncbi:hypothetical protein OCU04_004394 [Sclerotinia nivalis]|uniref:Uncharacterized protein n=1 Tax=Sclerotinia nivalis TaxID=352851 RepID=A0A9X0AR63_9HELO|nr:hypothetical protein OCU04_004394 [Sclerotinia nivalis]